MASTLLLGNRLKASRKLEGVDPMVDRLAQVAPLETAFAGTVVHRNPVYDITLLGLIAQPMCLLAGRGAGVGGSVAQDGELASTASKVP